MPTLDGAISRHRSQSLLIRENSAYKGAGGPRRLRYQFFGHTPPKALTQEQLPARGYPLTRARLAGRIRNQCFRQQLITRNRYLYVSAFVPPLKRASHFCPQPAASSLRELILTAWPLCRVLHPFCRTGDRNDSTEADAPQLDPISAPALRCHGRRPSPGRIT